MTAIEILDSLPLWGIFIIFMIIILLSNEAGFLLGKQAKKNDSRVKKIRTGPGVAAVLGLLAFMLAFAFSTVTSRFEDRKQLVLEEANAIGTAYLRADLLPASEAAQVKRILQTYIDYRLNLVASGTVQRAGSMVRVKEMQKQLWVIAVEVAARNPSPVTALFLQSLNDLIDLHMKRVIVGIHHRMPSIFWEVLFMLTIFSMIVAGYDSGLMGGRRSTTSLISISMTFGVVLLLIVALERPGHKLSSATQSALIELQQDIQSAKP